MHQFSWTDPFKHKIRLKISKSSNIYTLNQSKYTTRLNLFKEIIAVYFRNYTEPIHTLDG
jgi:hypothetical protein